MPDISMCAAECPKSKQCYRHEDSGTKPSEYRQAYIIRHPTGDDCELYWPVAQRFNDKFDMEEEVEECP